MHDDRGSEERTFVEGQDFYFDNGLMVLTGKYLLDRGDCCSSGCRHCPYGEATLQQKDLDLITPLA